MPEKPTAIERYWKALGEADGATMATCYTDDAVFDDAVFSLNGGKRIGAMWKTLLPPGNDARITTQPLTMHERHAFGRWEAVYKVGERQVRNRVASTFIVRDGAIVGQEDSFSFWRWSRQAFGWAGAAFGWTPVMRRAVQWRLARRIRPPEPAAQKAADKSSAKPWANLAARLRRLAAKESKKAGKVSPKGAKPAKAGAKSSG